MQGPQKCPVFGFGTVLYHLNCTKLKKHLKLINKTNVFHISHRVQSAFTAIRVYKECETSVKLRQPWLGFPRVI
jgi:hypothetical protein